jgi:hypothetical protein
MEEAPLKRFWIPLERDIQRGDPLSEPNEEWNSSDRRVSIHVQEPALTHWRHDRHSGIFGRSTAGTDQSDDSRRPRWLGDRTHLIEGRGKVGADPRPHGARFQATDGASAVTGGRRATTSLVIWSVTRLPRTRGACPMCTCPAAGFVAGVRLLLRGDLSTVLI